MPEGNPPEVSVFIHSHWKMQLVRRAIPSVCTQITVLTIWTAVKIPMSCAEHHVEEPSPAR